jgi:hypothetical protein
VLRTFHDTTNKRKRKLFARSINAIVSDIPQWLPWSERDMLWSRKDHPERPELAGKVVGIRCRKQKISTSEFMQPDLSIRHESNECRTFSNVPS